MSAQTIIIAAAAAAAASDTVATGGRADGRGGGRGHPGDRYVCQECRRVGRPSLGLRPSVLFVTVTPSFPLDMPARDRQTDRVDREKLEIKLYINILAGNSNICYPEQG